MKEPVFVGATAVLCHHCGGSVLTWSPDRWLAAHEQVFKCGGCGRLHVSTPMMRTTAAAQHSHDPTRPRD